VAAPRFQVSIEASGDLRPGVPTVLALSGTSNRATRLAGFSIHLPEVEAAKQTSWGPDFRVPEGEPLPPAARWQTGTGSGSPFQYTTSVTIPEPGYYRVVATARKASGEPAISSEGERIQDIAHARLWLLVREGGGVVTASFEPDSLPPGAVRSPGPLRFRRSGYRPGRGQLGTGVRPGKDGVGRASVVHTVLEALQGLIRRVGLDRSSPVTGLLPQTELTWKILYYNEDDSSFVGLPDAHYQVEFFEKTEECEDSAPLGCPQSGFDTGKTNSQGYIILQCRDGEFYDGSVSTKNTILFTNPLGGDGFSGDFDFDCGQIFQTTATASVPARVFVGTTMSAQQSQALLGVSRPQIEVELSESTDYSGVYFGGSTDLIRIDTMESTWGPFGYTVQAHEYGHAVHEKALGGIPVSGSCPDDVENRFTDETNLACAFTEGFATYHAALTMGSLAGEHFNHVKWTSTDVQDGSDGALIEGAVAAFFFDITDDMAEHSGELNDDEPDDLALAPSWLGQVIATCEVLDSGIWFQGLRDLWRWNLYFESP